MASSSSIPTYDRLIIAYTIHDTIVSNLQTAEILRYTSTHQYHSMTPTRHHILHIFRAMRRITRLFSLDTDNAPQDIATILVLTDDEIMENIYTHNHPVDIMATTSAAHHLSTAQARHATITCFMNTARREHAAATRAETRSRLDRWRLNKHTLAFTQ